jgi:thiamine biosynthesis lipoprotein
VIKRGHRKIILTASVAAVVLLAAALGLRSYNMRRHHVEKQTRFLMDTFVTIYAIGPPQTGARAIKAAFERMQEVDAKFNHLNPGGPIYAFNHSGTPITDPEILMVARKAQAISTMTGGAFDITVAPLITLWGFYGDNPAVPDDAAIQDCLRRIGYRKLRIGKEKMVKTDPDVRIDMGGIAKGYCVDQARVVLAQHGITSALIDAGGDVFALGRRANELWKIGIRSPRGDDLLGFMEVQDLAVMGSGDYERFFTHGGKRYHHIFDPRTGYPARGFSGTTLMHADPMLADAWNTAVFVLGPEKGPALLEQIPGMEAVMIGDAGNVTYTSGLADALKINTESSLSFAKKN